MIGVARAWRANTINKAIPKKKKYLAIKGYKLIDIQRNGVKSRAY
jgi:hypothetical protein